ncbi:MAG: imidazole glycerol phosphate synthase subunit HisH [Microthrixaceae bacterium]
MTRPSVAVLDYGIGNLRSAEKALQHVGADAALTADAERILAADAVVLPGVGAFGPCADALVASGLDDVARRVIAAGAPFLGICVGMQLLYESSEESPGARGLGVLHGAVRRLPGGVKHPQMQWNRLEVHRAGPLFDGLGDQPWMYFVHSFAAAASDDVVATCDYGGAVTAAAQRGNVVAVQFHPEKSGAAGLRLLGNFVHMASTGSVS